MSKLRYNALSNRRDFQFDVTVEEFTALSAVEDMPNGIKDHVDLGTYLDSLPGISRTEYNGHFGPHIFVTVDTDEDDWEWRLGMVDRAIGNFMDDARRLSRFFPDVVKGKHEYEDELRVLYSDEDFVILSREHSRVLIGSAAGTVALSGGEFVIDTVREDQQERRHLEEEGIWLPVTPSRDIADIRKWVSTFVALPDVTTVPTISVENRWLSLHMPEGARAVWANDDFIVADKNGNLSVTFKTKDSTGTKCYMEAARDQLLSLVAQSNAGRGGAEKLARYLERQIGDDLVRAPRMR